jgi:uncharacterized protein YecE (DUF72 family)
MGDDGIIRVGTSGWNYAHWKGRFYPSDLAVEEWLSYYAERLPAVEINNTFYHLPSSDAIHAWKTAVPEPFRFSVKASRYITHMKKLKDPDQSTVSLCRRIALLDDHLGPILFQLPPRWHRNPERLEAFLEHLRTAEPGVVHRPVFEFRDQQWFAPEIYELLQRFDAAFCIYQLSGRDSPREVTADFVYVRLHGPQDAYEGSYDRRALAGWAGAASSWSHGGLDVYIFFDNDQNAFAARNACDLATMVA